MNTSMVHDHRDRAVLRQLWLHGVETVTTDMLWQLYQTHTDIVRASTIRRRIERLTSSDQFRDAGFGEWRWVGEPPDEYFDQSKPTTK